MKTDNNGVMTEQDEAVEEKVTTLLPLSVLSGLCDANWKERLSAMEKMTEVCFVILSLWQNIAKVKKFLALAVLEFPSLSRMYIVLQRSISPNLQR